MFIFYYNKIFRMRGPELAFMNLYEFVALISIIPIPKDEDNPIDNNEGKNKSDIHELPINEKKNTYKNVGRWKNKIYYFRNQLT